MTKWLRSPRVVIGGLLAAGFLAGLVYSFWVRVIVSAVLVALATMAAIWYFSGAIAEDDWIPWRRRHD